MKALVVGNWKMNPATYKEARALFDETRRMVGLLRGVSVIVAPPAIFLRDLTMGLRKGRVAFAVQNAHYESSGAHTGEISLPQAKDSKATYVIIGHAERRAAGESNDDTRLKVGAALAAGMTPILCVGEKTREQGAEYFAFVREQLRTGLPEDAAKKIAKVIIAYEPVWAIGAPKPMQPRDMHEMGIFIRKTLVEKFGDQGHKTTILYGGAVDASNAGTMLREGDVKGFLVGRASSQVQSMTELLRAVAEA
jgi:triosephosphate isomerase